MSIKDEVKMRCNRLLRQPTSFRAIFVLTLYVGKTEDFLNTLM